MSIPGVLIQELDAAPLSAARLRLSTPFVIGELGRGSLTPTFVRSMRDVVRTFGVRTTDTAHTHDWLDAYFRDGGSEACLVRLLGAAPVKASVELDDNAEAVALTVTAIEAGVWANGAAGGLSVDVDVDGTDFEVKIYLDEELVERSGMVADGAAAAAWAAANSSLVTITDGPGGDPVATVAPTNLTGGDDDFDGITQTEITAALESIPASMGPGAIVLPGRTGTTEQLAAAEHGSARNRIVRADLPNTSTVGTLTAAAATLRASDHADRIDILAPMAVVPGLTQTGIRYVPASALRCAAESRNEAAGISPNQPAAGEWGKTDYAQDVAVTWGESDLESLYEAGINVLRFVDGELKLYGARTAADPDENPAGVSLGAARLRMAVREIARFRAEQVVFTEVDSGGVVLGTLKGQISGDIKSRYAKSLWPVNLAGDPVAVSAELVDGDTPGTYEIEVLVKFRPAGSAEVVNVTISRTVSAS